MHFLSIYFENNRCFSHLLIWYFWTCRLSLNKSSSEATSFHYSDLIKVQSEIEENFKLMCGINVSKLKLKTFEAPKIASINISGKVSYLYFIGLINYWFDFFILDTH